MADTQGVMKEIEATHDRRRSRRSGGSSRPCARAARSAGLLDGIRVDYYGTPTPVNQMASISVPDARTIVIQPWEAGRAGDREGDQHLRSRPDPGQRRQDRAASRCRRRPRSGASSSQRPCTRSPRNPRVAVRNSPRRERSAEGTRQDKKVSEDEERRSHDQIQKTTDRFIAKVDELLKKKEQEILSF